MQRNLAGECEKNDQRNASVITLAEPLFSLAIPGPPICLLWDSNWYHLCVSEHADHMTTSNTALSMSKC